MTEKNMSIEHALVRSTVRIRSGKAGDQPSSIGTGFFYKVLHPGNGNAKILIVTNKHVVRNAEVVYFTLSSAKSVTDIDEQNQPRGRKDQEIMCPLAGNLFNHPNPEIDLCAIDVTIPTGQILQSGNLYLFSLITSTDSLQSLSKLDIQ